MPLDVPSIAVDILRARETTPPKLVIDGIANTSLDTAYAVQLETTNRRLKRGETQIGFKVGCTSQPIQDQLDIHEPIFGRLFEQDRQISPHSIDRNEFDGLAVEGELAVELERDPRDLRTSHVDIERAISRVFPVIELHHFRIPTDALTAPVLVANNAIHAGFVQTQNEKETQISNSVKLSIHFNGGEVASIPFEDLEETIFSSLIWLQEELIANDDTPTLPMPVIILCGSVAPLFRLTEPTSVSVSIGAHETVRCNVR